MQTFGIQPLAFLEETILGINRIVVNCQQDFIFQLRTLIPKECWITVALLTFSQIIDPLPWLQIPANARNSKGPKAFFQTIRDLPQTFWIIGVRILIRQHDQLLKHGIMLLM